MLLKGLGQAQQTWIPEIDQRLKKIRTFETPTHFYPIKNRQQWLSKARSLRRHILSSSGLWPFPEKSPLRPKIFGKIDRNGYSIEKVYFESYPGFYVTGNLYRPLGKKGPFPGILSPHGHWNYGRLENSERCSVPGRCINLALQGYIVFSYDMIGYNDSRQVEHRLSDKRLELWGIGSLSLHLWNSIRAVDFLQSLPDVDKDQIGCTGASGGGTQTFLLSAIDDRIKVAAPVNMISHDFQGGDTCENAPNLRLDANNMEIGALMAPRPLLLVSAQGDWTWRTPRIEFPAISRIYSLLNAKDKIKNVQVAAIHNYNQESREAVYSWFDYWFFNKKDTLSVIKERSFSVESPADLLVFFGTSLPKSAKTQNQLVAYLVSNAQEQLIKLFPQNKESLKKFKQVLGPLMSHSLAASFPVQSEIRQTTLSRISPKKKFEFSIGRKGRGDRVPVTLWLPKNRGPLPATLLIHPEGEIGINRKVAFLLKSLLKKGHLVMSLDCFNTGKATDMTDSSSSKFFTTYNRTPAALRIQDILTGLAYLKNRKDVSVINLVGLEEAGLWCLLARSLAPRLNTTVVDVAQFPNHIDQAYLNKLFIPLIRRAGEFKTALTLSPTTRLLIHNTGNKFDTSWVKQLYKIAGSESELRIEMDRVPLSDMASWIR